MDWTTLLTVKRHGHEYLHSGEIGRSHFHKDHDRIVFSSAFRRLGRKTQVHPMALNDHIHTRLTHSIEVGSVGRSLGIMLGEKIHQDLPSWIGPHDIGTIVQSACLAHDIGNPPFGHAGEFAIRDWFAQERNSHLLQGIPEHILCDFLTFEGNAQGFRVVTCIENNLFEGGLRLTYPTLGTLLKYPWTSSLAGDKGKFSCFQAEVERLNMLGEALGLVPLGENVWSRHPLSFLMEAADDICYAILDLEDAIELNILGFNEVKPILMQLAGGGMKDRFMFDSAVSARRKVSALRGRAMENMVNSALSAFMNHYEEIMQGEFKGELLQHGCVEVKEGLHNAKSLAKNRVFPDTRKAEIEVGAYSTLGCLLDAFCYAAYENHTLPQSLSYRNNHILSLMGVHRPDEGMPLATAYMRVLDFVSGMTDNYAAYLARQIGGLS